MAHVAREMQRQGFKIPLLIGGATTSRVHTAVKIAPCYEGPTIYGPDASRAVSACAPACSRRSSREEYLRSVRQDYEKIRAQHAAKKGQTLVPLAQARANAHRTDWRSYAPPRPRFLGRKVLRACDLAEIAACIDWSPFFQTWDLAGSYPKILEDPVVGEAARGVFAEGKAMLERIIAGKSLKANAVLALHPAASVGDDIEIYRDESRHEVAMVWHCLRQQAEKASDRANLCLADFVAPKSSGVPDYIGAFAVTAGIGIDERVSAFEAEARRLQRHHVQGPRRPARGSLHRAAAPARAQGILGLRGGRGALQRRADRGEVPGHPSRARATPPAPITPRRVRSSIFSERRTRASP